MDKDHRPPLVEFGPHGLEDGVSKVSAVCVAGEHNSIGVQLIEGDVDLCHGACHVGKWQRCEKPETIRMSPYDVSAELVDVPGQFGGHLVVTEMDARRGYGKDRPGNAMTIHQRQMIRDTPVGPFGRAIR